MMITVTQTPGLLKVGDSAAAQKFVDQLKSTAAPQAQAQLLTQLQLLEDSSLAPPARLDVLELLREPIVTTQESRVREFAGKPVPFDDETRDVFTRTITLWQTVANAYESLITAMAEDGSPLAATADVVCYRALRAVHQAFAAFRRAYHEPTPALWQQLHRLYAFAESAHVTAVPFAEKTVTKSTAGLLYLQVVLAQKVQPDALSQTQMNILDRILDKWGILGLIASEPPQVQPDKLLTVDLDSGTGAHLGHVDSRSSRRYLLIDAVGEQLREAALGLKKSSPDKLGLGPVPRDACEKLLLSAYTQWFAPGSGRVDERKPASFNVMVSNTLSAIHYNLSGKPFTSPDTGLSSRAKFDLAGFERVDGPAVGGSVGPQPGTGNLDRRQSKRLGRARYVPQSERRHAAQLQPAAGAGRAERQCLHRIRAASQCRSCRCDVAGFPSAARQAGNRGCPHRRYSQPLRPRIVGARSGGQGTGHDHPPGGQLPSRWHRRPPCRRPDAPDQTDRLVR